MGLMVLQVVVSKAITPKHNGPFVVLKSSEGTHLLSETYLSVFFYNRVCLFSRMSPINHSTLCSFLRELMARTVVNRLKIHVTIHCRLMNFTVQQRC